jgi:hypothetical protein
MKCLLWVFPLLSAHPGLAGWANVRQPRLADFPAAVGNRWSSLIARGFALLPC